MERKNAASHVLEGMQAGDEMERENDATTPPGLEQDVAMYCLPCCNNLLVDGRVPDVGKQSVGVLSSLAHFKRPT